MRLGLALLLLLAGAAQGATPPPWTMLFGPAYRTSTESTVAVSSSFTASANGVSFQGWAQVPSSNALRTRSLFALYPSESSTVPLISVWIANSRYLCANLSTSAGAESVTGPNITTDSWFSFGVAVGVGTDRGIRFYAADMVNSGIQNPTYSWAPFGLRGDLLPSSAAVAVAPALSPTTSPVPVYMTTLRVITGAIQYDTFGLLTKDVPAPYFNLVGNVVGGIAFELTTSSANVSCPSGMKFSSVITALYGRPRGIWPNSAASPICNVGTIAKTASACLGKPWCIVPHSNDRLTDPCEGRVKWLSVALTCSAPTVSPQSMSRTRSLSSSTSAPVTSNSSSRPTTSRKLSSSGAWQVSLQVSQSTLGVNQDALKDALVRDLSAALRASTDRFVLVAFGVQTPLSTLVSFVIVANETDTDGTVLLDAFRTQLQTPGSAVRAGAVLCSAAAPPVSIQVVAVHLTTCPSGAVTLGSASCPVSTQSATAQGLFQRTLLMWIGPVVVMSVVLVVGVCCWVRCCAKPRPAAQPMSTLQSTVPVEFPFSGPVAFAPDSRTGTTIRGQTMKPSTAPYPPVVPLTSSWDGAAAVYAADRASAPALDQYGSYFSQNDLGDVALGAVHAADSWGADPPQGPSQAERPVPDF